MAAIYGGFRDPLERPELGPEADDPEGQPGPPDWYRFGQIQTETILDQCALRKSNFRVNFPIRLIPRESMTGITVRDAEDLSAEELQAISCAIGHLGER